MPPPSRFKAFRASSSGTASFAKVFFHEHLSVSGCRSLQLTLVRKLLQHAGQHVPYYKELFERKGLKPASLRSFDDLCGYPVLTRETVQNHLEGLISQTLNYQDCASLVRVSTTGSSGTPVTTCLSRTEFAQGLSYVLYGFFKNGASPLDTLVNIHVVEQRDGQHPAPDMRFPRLMNIDLREGEPAVLARLKGIRSSIVCSFPSYLLLLSDHLLQHHVARPDVKFIVSNGEVLTDSVRARIRDAFRCPVFDSYGATEVFRIAYECNQHSLHIIPDSCFVEIDETTLAPDGTAEILVTPLYLKAMPLIRYRLGDRIRLSPVPCACGSSFDVITSVVGRADDLVTLPSGRRISPRAINTMEFVKGVSEYQIIQKSHSSFTVLVHPSKNHDESSRTEIARMVAEGCAPERIDVSFQMVESIPRSRTGKLQAVISEVQ